MDVRISNHQQFDVISCKLCDKIYTDPRLLECLHSFCKDCLETYVEGSSSELPCPLCQEVTPLTSEGVEGLMENTLLDRFIAQARNEKTILVADREVREMRRQASLTRGIPNHDNGTAVINETGGSYDIEHFEEEITEMSNGGSFTDSDVRQLRHEMRAQMSSLQEKAMDVVSAIDRVNQGFEEWTENKNKLRECIKQRSQILQNTVKTIERQFLARIDNRDVETEMKSEVTEVKGKLHKDLKGILNAVDFLKLLVEFGDKADLTCYQTVVEERANKLTPGDIEITQREATLRMPHAPIDGEMEELFGTLTEYSGTKSIWEARKSDLNLPSLSTSYTTEDLSQQDQEAMESKADRYLMPRFEFVKSLSVDTKHTNGAIENGAQTNRRRPLKSMSFDAATLGETADVYTNLHKLHKTDDVNDDDENDNNNNTDEQIETESDTISSNPFQTYNYWASTQRRVSAPPATIRNTLAKRQLNALSILERSNINTEGYRFSNDVASGLNQARLEWVRDNVRRKATGWKSTSERY